MTDSTAKTFRVPLAEALAAAEQASWLERQDGCEHCDHRCGPPPRRLIHSQGSMCGADWDLDDVLALIRRSAPDGRLWVWSMLNHDLAIRDDDNDRWMRFEVRAPDRVRAAWRAGR